LEGLAAGEWGARISPEETPHSDHHNGSHGEEDSRLWPAKNSSAATVINGSGSSFDFKMIRALPHFQAGIRINEQRLLERRFLS
jgi:hypothetical protein